jgi:hypothetical protein
MATRTNDSPRQVHKYLTDSDIRENDILCGRGDYTVRNQGNVRFRQVISEYKVIYARVGRNRIKNELGREALRKIREEGGRFLRKATEQEAEHLGIPSSTDIARCWVEVVDEGVMLKKVKQSMRDMSARKKESLTISTDGQPDVDIQPQMQVAPQQEQALHYLRQLQQLQQPMQQQQLQLPLQPSQNPLMMVAVDHMQQQQVQHDVLLEAALRQRQHLLLALQEQERQVIQNRLVANAAATQMSITSSVLSQLGDRYSGRRQQDPHSLRLPDLSQAALEGQMGRLPSNFRSQLSGPSPVEAASASVRMPEGYLAERLQQIQHELATQEFLARMILQGNGNAEGFFPAQRTSKRHKSNP